MSPDALNDVESRVLCAIRICRDIGQAIHNVARDVPVPHPAFVIYSGDEKRKLLYCQVKPVSDWALGIIISTLDSRGAGAAYDFFQRTEWSFPSVSFREQLWEQKSHQYLCSGYISSLTIRCLEDGDSSTTEWQPFEIFASFDAIIYLPDKPDSSTVTKENQTHVANTCRSMLLSKKLLRSSDAVLNPLRPLEVGIKPWIILFVVPVHIEDTFKKQKFKPDVAFWQEETKQYVLGLDKYAVFHYDS